MANGLLAALGLKQKPGSAPRGGAAMPPPGATAVAAAGTAVPPPAGTVGSAPSTPADEYSPVITKKPAFLDPSSPEMRDLLMKGIQEQAEKDRQEAEAALKRIDKALGEIKAYILQMPSEQLQKSGYAKIMGEVRKRYPEVAGVSQWVRSTSLKVPALKGRLPSPKALMDVVESAVKSRNADLNWSMSTGKDLASVNTDRLLAAYMAELPAGVSAAITGGVVQLTLEGAALSVAVPGGGVADASAGKAGTSISFKATDFAIQVANAGWKDFDPELRARWQKIGDAAGIVLKLKADRDQARLELEQKKKDGAKVTADLTADFEKKEAAFNLAWTKLQERITVAAKATEEKVTASIAYLKKDKDDKDAVKAGIEADADLKKLQGQLKAYYTTPTIDAVAQIVAAADKVSARVEVAAVKSGVVVTANFEQALEETKVAIDVLLKEGKDSSTKLAAELKKKADDLSAKVKLVQQTKDLKLAAELEKTLKDVRGSIEVEAKKGSTTVKGGASGSSSGELGGQVQIDIALRDGRTFKSEGDKLSFTAAVSNKGYKFGVAFSMGEPVEPASLQDLFGNADRQIKELYKLAGDKGVRSIQDVEALNRKMQEVMAPVNEAAKKAKTLKGKQQISASFGFTVQGDWPAGGKASPPAIVAGATLHF